MFAFDGSCPHCNSDKGFVAFGASIYIVRENHKKIEKKQMCTIIERNENNPIVEFSLAGSCLRCNCPVVATCESREKTYLEIRKSIENQERGCIFPISVKRIFPSPTPPYAHDSLPDNVRVAFIDLQNMVKEGKQPFFIISGCRIVLEESVKVIGSEDGKLYERIENLYSRGIITESLKDWATIIRKTGNAGSHSMAGTPQQAQELVNFTRVFLQFTFELPATIASLRHRES